MSFNNGNERRKLNAKWEQLRVQYREAGMSEEAIQAMYEFDLGVLNSERAYDASTVAVCDGEYSFSYTPDQPAGRLKLVNDDGDITIEND